MDTETMTVKDVAVYLRVHTDMIYASVKQKEIPHMRLGRSDFIYERIDLSLGVGARREKSKRGGMIKVNYIKELNAFSEWLLVHELPASAIVLWYTLMIVNYVARWKRTFNAPNGVTQQLSGLSKSGVHVARKCLVEHGLITYEPGEKGKAPGYEMISLVQQTHTSIDPSVNRSINEPCTIHKQKQNKERQEEEGKECKLVHLYEQNIGKFSPITKAAFNQWVDMLGEDVMFEAIKLTCKHNGRTFRYLE